MVYIDKRLHVSAIERLVLLFSIILICIGDRLGNAGISVGIIRSIHLVDIFTPAYVFFTLRNINLIQKRVLFIASVWLFYGYFTSLIMISYQGLAESHNIIGAIAFATKELQFFFFLTFIYIISFKNITYVTQCFNIASFILAVWAIKELFFPTGFYFIGLPFEAGPSQTAAVYGLMLIINIVILQEDKRSNIYVLRLFVTIGIVIGLIGSLSRSGLVGIIPALVYLIFAKRKTLFYIIFIGGLLPIFAHEAILLIYSRITDISIHAVDRINKWRELLDYVFSDPLTTIFGAGYGTPNYLVLGQELGFILAVDNAYVRRIFELGLFGVTIFFIYIFILNISYFTKNTVPLTLFIIFMGITLETFQVSQTALLYYGLLPWMFVYINTINRKDLIFLKNNVSKV